MQTIKIPLSGITRNTDDGVSVDGSCMELINARSKNGSIEPVGQPIKIAQLDKQFKNIYRHEKADRYLGVTTEEELYEISTDFKSVKTLSVSGVKGVEFIGFTVSLLTQDGIKYMLFKHEAYYYLGELPELPEIALSYEVGIKNVTETASWNLHSDRYDKEFVKEKKEAFDKVTNGALLKGISELNKDGYFTNLVGLRFAFRLYDGSHIKHSPIRTISLTHYDTIDFGTPEYGSWIINDPNDDYSIATKVLDTWDDQSFYFYQAGIKPKFGITDFNLDAWKDLIVSIDIFATRQFGTPIVGEEIDTPKPIQAFVRESMFYRIASISLSGVLDYISDDVSPDSLVLSDRLTDDANTHQKLIALNSYVYNNRLHIYDTVQLPFDGYNMDYLKDYDKTTSTEYGKIQVYVCINTNYGESVVFKEEQMFIPKVIPPFLMYPDSRAYKMVIKIFKANGDMSQCKSFDLIPHKSLNLSYSIFNKYKYRDTTRADSTGRPPSGTIYASDNPQPDYIEDWQTTDIPVYGSPVAEIDNAKLMVSALNNPFYFPPETTYQFQSEIIALQSNTTALSQGQFGQHPLYVFCKNGVEAMTVGNGTVAYATATPVTRDAAVSSNVCGMDSFVCFLSARGVMLIQGTQTRCISEGIDGFLPSCLGTSIMNKILSIPDMYENASIVPFYEFIQNASIGYNYLESEIIVANKLYHYSYVYNMNSAQWHKINTSISTFINTYPETYAMLHKEGTTIIQDLNNKNLSVAKIAILTRPIKLGTTTHKRILQTALRGIVKKSLSDLYLREQQVVFRGEPLMIFNDVAFYILGSNDTENYALIGGKEKISELRDLVTKMNKSKAYKYFMICLIGGVRSDVSINYVEMVVDETFANRLR